MQASVSHSRSEVPIKKVRLGLLSARSAINQKSVPNLTEWGIMDEVTQDPHLKNYVDMLYQNLHPPRIY